MKKNIVKIVGIILIILLLVLLNKNVLTLSPQMIKDWVMSFGVIAPIIFIALYMFRPLILFPASIMSIVGGMTFGAVAGTIYTVLGASLGAALSFFIARKLGMRFVKQKQEKSGGKLEKIQADIERKGFLYVFFLRMIPLFNFDLISYTSGLSRVKFFSFFTATLIGIIPGTFAYNFLGSSFLSGNWKVIATATLLFLAILIIPVVIKGKFLKKQELKS